MFALDYPDAKPAMECMIRFAEYEKEFGPANSDVIKEMGKSFYNMELNMNGTIFHMVLSRRPKIRNLRYTTTSRCTK